MEKIKCQSCGNIFENETDFYQLCPNCYADYLFYDRASDELRREIKKNTGSFSDIERLDELKERYSRAARRYSERLYKNKYLINSTYKCKKCNAKYESHYDTIFCDTCREDWNKLRSELGFDKPRGELDFLKYKKCDAHEELLEAYADYDELYDKHNRERLGL
ncbi:Zn finger protein HypA/HybF involved in hydrogenase expression [Desulfomicrobium macestii]|uniref:Zn finger protein HypA/HybF involved in hydrogenase expression n=1 Tax=Desulfomicrobium macestii TaxID=90731 RepID=A0ABR9H8G2_9BACT|nr:hypothetical protein [Desulfomicrobium macestii]MBE1427012.1 Zn finger protein HypA/HybF involved in hydrogenase expression [Desulfomicrobium macestii]